MFPKTMERTPDKLQYKRVDNDFFTGVFWCERFGGGHIEMKLTNGNSYFYFILHGYCPFILRSIDEVIELKKLIDEVLK